jgi:hypothetical protein
MRPLQVAVRSAEVDLRQWLGGFETPKAHYLSWILSACQLTATHGAPTLFAEPDIATLFLDVLELPYQRVVTHWCQPYPPPLWAYAKAQACARMDGPFMCVDGDCILWKLQAVADPIHRIFVLTRETDSNSNIDLLYNYPRHDFKNTMPYWPPLWDTELHYGFKLGLHGGADVALYNRAAAVAEAAVRLNGQLWTRDAKYLSRMNRLLDSWTLATQAMCHDVDPVVAYEDYEVAEEASVRLGITHLGASKGDGWVASRLESRAQRDWPAHYERLMRWLA